MREELLQKKQRSPSTAGTAASKGAIAGVKRPRPAANSWGPGRTLHDEGPVASLNPTAAAPARASGAADTKVKRGTGPRRRALVLRSREDVEAGLLRAAARGGGGQGGESAALSEFFKAASCIALRQQYDVSRATGRLAAALAGAYSLRPLSDGRSLRAGTPMQLEVRFSPRAAASSAAAAASSSAAAASFAVEVEVVDNLPAEALVAVLRGVLESAAAAAASGAGAGEEGGGAVLELLKPHMLAQVSPRQFWGVVRWGGLLLVRRQGPEGPPSFDLSAETPWGRPVDPAAALAALVPSADWAFLARRPRRPTEKALAAAAEAAARGGGARTRPGRGARRRKRRRPLLPLTLPLRLRMQELRRQRRRAHRCCCSTHCESVEGRRPRGRGALQPWRRAAVPQPASSSSWLCRRGGSSRRAATGRGGPGPVCGS